MSSYIDSLNQLTRQYNDAIRALEASYNMESTSSVGWNLTSSHLRRQYSKRYDLLAREYTTKKRQLLSAYQQVNPTWAKWRHRWERFFIIALIAVFFSFTAAIAIVSEDPEPSSVMSQEGITYWNAENIDIPYLTDETQYVSNPDAVLTQDAVDLTLGRLEKELGIQSIWVVVNHIENDDPFRMAQDIGNKYHVGYDDRGLIVVVGYQDHSINMSPGRKLEADLTDAECHRLEQQYVVPAMRAEMPDSGMIYLAQALFATLQKKELPQMSQLMSDQDDELDDQIAAFFGILFVLIIAGGAGFLRLNRKYQWIPLVGAVSLLSNPFYTSDGGGFFIGGGGGSFGGGGGGFSGGGGGSFGGGSFGGGGATSRW